MLLYSIIWRLGVVIGLFVIDVDVDVDDDDDNDVWILYVVGSALYWCFLLFYHTVASLKWYTWLAVKLNRASVNK